MSGTGHSTRPALTYERCRMLPTPGRIVTYTRMNGNECPAMVTRANEDGTLHLTAFPWEAGVPYEKVSDCREGAPEERGTWRWPERVE